jgi:hypothetical protein
MRQQTARDTLFDPTLHLEIDQAKRIMNALRQGIVEWHYPEEGAMDEQRMLSLGRMYALAHTLAEQADAIMDAVEVQILGCVGAQNDPQAA